MAEPRLALLSVADERGLVPLAAGLARLGYILVAPAKTRATLAQAGLEALPLGQLTGAPSILGGQVDSLHPAVHGGIVARRDQPQDLKTLRDFGVAPIDVVVANFALPPAGEPALPAVAQANDQVALLRAAALSFRDVWPLFDPQDYEAALAQLAQGEAALAARKALAAKALAQLAAWDLALAEALGAPRALGTGAAGPGGQGPGKKDNEGQDPAPVEPTAGALTLALGGEAALEVQENPQVKARLWRDLTGEWLRPAPYRQLHGAPLTYRAVIEADAAWRAVLSLPEGAFAAAVAKFGQPCGAASMQMSLAAAVLRAIDAEPVAAVGAALALNRAVDLGAARALASKPWQAVLAPDFEDEAVEFLKSVGEIRLLAMGPLGRSRGQVLRQVRTGSLGVLITQLEPPGEAVAGWTAAPSTTRAAIQPNQRAAMALAWQLVQHCKAAAVVLADEHGSVGIGAGQVNLADAAQIAAGKSRKGYRPLAAAFGAPLQGAEALAPLVRLGVQAVIQPGGAAADAEVIAAADGLGLAMVLAGPTQLPP